MGKIISWYRRLRGDGPLVPIGLAIGGMLALAVAIAAAVTITGLSLLHFRGFRPEPLLSAGSLYDLLKVAFAFAAGIGGVIALVTAYRRQRIAEFAQDLATRAEDREAARLFNERFTTAAGQLGDDKPAVRLAGVYAMAGLADDWPSQRQTCVDVLCAYLRMPYEPDAGPSAPAGRQQAFRALREVRHTVIRVITAHLQREERRAATAQDWRGLDLDFTGAVFDGGSFDRAEFTGGTVSFDGAAFICGTVSFAYTTFAGAAVSFADAQFSGGTVSFTGAQITSGVVVFHSAQFTGATVSFYRAVFTGATVTFGKARFADGTVSFDNAMFRGDLIRFDDAQFAGCMVRFNGVQFAGATVSFDSAVFTGGVTGFDDAAFAGGEVSFTGTAFTGGEVNFTRVGTWQVPPQLPSWTNPPPGVMFPADRR